MVEFVWSLVFTVVVFCQHLNAKKHDKRVLLNDPNLVHTQIQAIQQELKYVKSYLTNTIATQQAEIDSLKRATNNQYAN